MFSCFLQSPRICAIARYQRFDGLQQNNGFNCKIRSKMAQKDKRLNRFSRLDTIMEATQREESDNGGRFHLELPQKSLASPNEWNSVGSEALQDLVTSRRTRIRNRSEQREHNRPTLRNDWSAESLLKTTHGKQARNSEMTQKDNRNVRDNKQVEILFPEFFSSRENSSFVQQSDWYYSNNHQGNMANEKVREDPFVRSWLYLFGACSCA